MKKFGKLLALLLTAVMAMSALCISSSAESAYTDMENIKATWTNDISAKTEEFWDNSSSWKWYCYQFDDPYHRGSLTFELNKKYSKVSFYIINNDNNKRITDIEFYGDGKLLFSKRGMTAFNGQYIDFSVKKVNKLTVYLKNGRYLLLANGKFQKNTLKLSDSELKLDIKGSATLGFTYKDGADKKITTGKIKYASENSKIAKVSSKGKIVGVSAGVTNVTVTTRDGLVEKCKVIVLPKKVTGVKLASASSDSVKLQWDKVDGADSYEVGFYDPDLEEYEKLKSVSGTTANIKDLDSNTEYTFMVRACIKDGSKVYKGAFSDDFKTKTTK